MSLRSGDAVSRFDAVGQAKFPFLESMELSRDIESGTCSDYSLTLVLVPAQAGKSLRIVFEGVRDLRIGSLEGLLALRLELRSVRDSQLEGLRYRVVESEHEAFSFYCSNFVSMLKG